MQHFSNDFLIIKQKQISGLPGWREKMADIYFSPTKKLFIII